MQQQDLQNRLPNHLSQDRILRVLSIKGSTRWVATLGIPGTSKQQQTPPHARTGNRQLAAPQWHMVLPYHHP